MMIELWFFTSQQVNVIFCYFAKKYICNHTRYSLIAIWFRHLKGVAIVVDLDVTEWFIISVEVKIRKIPPHCDLVRPDILTRILIGQPAERTCFWLVNTYLSETGLLQSDTPTLAHTGPWDTPSEAGPCSTGKLI